MLACNAACSGKLSFSSSLLCVATFHSCGSAATRSSLRSTSGSEGSEDSAGFGQFQQGIFVDQARNFLLHVLSGEL
jgi:hypothetical protein